MPFCQRAIADRCRLLPRHERRNSRAKVLERVQGQQCVVELSASIDSELRSSGQRIHGGTARRAVPMAQRAPLTDPPADTWLDQMRKRLRALSADDLRPQAGEMWPA